MAYKTPGVYTEEISLLPPSVAEVETALPAIIGYTARAERRGQSLTNVPTRISSMLEYVEFFGGPPEPGLAAVTVDADDAVTDVAFTSTGHYHTFTAVRHFFDNGGGDCYVVSVGTFGDAVDLNDLTAGLAAVEAVDEPTILLAPDAALLADTAQFHTLQVAMLNQCVLLGDRVAVFDLKENTAVDLGTAVDDFRNAIGINGLKYGAAYTPWLATTYPVAVDFGLFEGAVEREGVGPIDLADLTPNDPALVELVSRAQDATVDRDALVGPLGVTDRTTVGSEVRTRYTSLRRALAQAVGSGDADDIRDAFNDLLLYVRQVATALAALPATAQSDEVRTAVEAYRSALAGSAYDDLIALEKELDDYNAPALVAIAPDLADFTTYATDLDTDYADLEANGFLSDTIANIAATGPQYALDGGNPDTNGDGDLVDAGGTVVDAAYLANALLPALDAVVEDGSDGLFPFLDAVAEAAVTEAQTAQEALYAGHPKVATIRDAIARAIGTVPPSGAVAGVYATVDRTRGVHKAPANVSLAYVSGPTVRLSDAEQAPLNVDAIAGKSINAIRSFAGRGTLVWGARTLAGNSNEWRYVPVRRLFNVVEESVKKSTAWAVFEPNDANLWVKVKGMIDNYLTTKWQEGALAGAAPADAFYTAVGLGQTMTPQDVLEGRLIVEIGLAAVRPAEFIVLRFSHKLQQS